MARLVLGLLPAEGLRLLVVFFLDDAFLAGRVALVFLLELLRAAVFLVFFLDFALDADFFPVTFFRDPFRLAFDLPALAVFFPPAFFLLGFFLVVDFLPVFFEVFLLTFFFVFFFEATFFRTAFLRDVFFATLFFEPFLAAAFLLGMRVIPGWLQTQPAIIQS